MKNEKLYIQNSFEIDEDGYHYSGGICLPFDEYQKLTEAEIEKIKYEQRAAWIKATTTIPEPVLIPVADQLKQVEEQLISLQGQVNTLTFQKESLVQIKTVNPTAKVDTATSAIPIKLIVGETIKG